MGRTSRPRSSWAASPSWRCPMTTPPRCGRARSRRPAAGLTRFAASSHSPGPSSRRRRTARTARRLAVAVAGVPGLEVAGPLLTVSDRRLSVRLTRGVMRIEPHHVGLARAISEVARQQGAVADRSAVHEVQIAVAARPHELDVGFWRAVLGYATLADDNGVDPLGHGSTFWMRDLD